MTGSHASARWAKHCPSGLLAAAALVAAFSGPASARTLAEVRALGTISMCASPETLPYASDKPGDPGFQVEVGRAIAEGLKLSLSIEWVVPRRRANVVNCDMQLDSVNNPEMYKGRALLSRPYQRSGVVLGFAPGIEPVQDYKDLPKDRKVGAMVGSVASVVLGKSGASLTPYAFQDDMVDELAKGAIPAAAVSFATLSYYIHKHQDAGVRMTYAFDSAPDLSWDVAVGLRKSDQALVDEVNKVLDSLIADGTLGRIYARYGVEHRLPK